MHATARAGPAVHLAPNGDVASYTNAKTEGEQKTVFESYGYQMVNNMTPMDRRAHGLPPYHLSEKELERVEARYSQNGHALLREQQRKDDEKAAKDWEEKETKRVYNFYYGDWPPEYATKFYKAWQVKMKMTRQQMFDALNANMSDPWMHINNCLARAPIDPKDPSHTDFEKNAYYDLLVPQCGAEWDWYNDPNTNKGDLLKQLGLKIRFESGIQHGSDKAWEDTKDKINDASKAAKAPFYTTMVVAAILGVAAIILKVF
jgi:hypothetical protein